MNRILNILLAIGLLQYVIVWYACVQNWFVNEKEVYAISSVVVGLAYLLKHFLNKKLDRKSNLLLIITILYLVFTSLAKYKMDGLTIFPIAILITTLILLSFELYDWLRARSKKHKMNLIQLLGLISFLVYLIFKIRHYPGAAIPMIFFHISLIGISIDLLTNRRYITPTKSHGQNNHSQKARVS